ncbi:MAG: hypothetical protein EXS37_21130 [Opitutus sp.]|nr:hypothetical protein [Opitutus sp.]
MRFAPIRFRVFRVFRGQFLLLVGLVISAVPASADPLSKKIDIDFFRDVPSRNLKGLAARSDGRLVAGPTLSEIATKAPADLLWCLERTDNPAKWLIGSGPDGRIVEITFDTAQTTYESRDLVKLDDPQVFALKRLPDGAILAGTSPKGALYLIRDDAVVARTALPVDSIFDLILLDANTALAATGNPGRIYKIDLEKFTAAGVGAEKITDAKLLAERGLTVFGEIRDRNVRRIVALADGRIAAGSAPKGNIYTFARDGGAPVILQENRDAEVTDLLPQPNGDLFATIVFTSTSNESRITPPAAAGKTGRDAKEETPPPALPERFGGRSTLILFPANGFAETLAARSNTAFYRIARRGDLLLVAGGEQGELVGYDLKARLSLSFAGSISAQLNGLAPFAPKEGAGTTDKFLVLRNNAPGFAVLEFKPGGTREAETRRLDLANASQLGALRFNRLRSLTNADVAPAIRTSNGSDEVEGWGPWTPLQASSDAGWRGENLRGRYVKLRIRVSDSAPAAGFEIDRASLFGLPQNRRPLLQEFRVLTPGFNVLAAHEQPPSAVVSLSQIIAGPKEDDRRRSAFLGSQVVPSPGTQVILWTITDPDNDVLLSTFSIRRDGDLAWTEMATATRDNYAQFATKNIPDGIYFTRLVVNETAPRPPGDRLTQTFETDDLIVDHTAPEMLLATAERTGTSLVITVRGRDQLSLLEGIEVIFNNGVRETLEQPADGVRDGREETFVLTIPLVRIANATSVEVTLYDLAGNGTAKRLNW